MNNKYIKVIYQTEPIGPEKIILELTTFDWEAFNKDEEEKKLQEKKYRERIEINPYEPLDVLEERLNKRVDEFYKKEIEVAYKQLEYCRMKHESIKAEWHSPKTLKNINNSENIYCDVIKGNVVNCDNVHCKEIYGNIVNSEIYKED